MFPLFSVFLLFSMFLLFSILLRKFRRTFETPICDDRSYKLIHLDNDLDVLLVHDPNATQSSAAVDINVGSFNNPKSKLGLANVVA